MDPKEALDADQVSRRLKPSHFIREIEILKSAPSTNTLLHERAGREPLEPGILLAAEEQTTGKGRMGRVWHSEPYQALTFSFLCINYFPSKPGWITLGAALAAAMAVEDETGLSPGIKWPNDIYLEGKKLGGVLAEALCSGDQDLVVVGMGINVNSCPEKMEAQEGLSPVCLREVHGSALDRSVLLAAILNSMDKILGQMAQGETHFLLNALRKRSLLIGRPAVFECKKARYQGKVLDHTEDLGILIETEIGRVVLPGETATLIRFQP